MQDREYDYENITTMYHSTRSAAALDRDAVGFLWDMVRNDPAARLIFRKMDVVSVDDMERFVNDPSHIMLLGLYKSRLCVFGWLNNTELKTAHVHFVTFKDSYRGVNKLTCEKIIQELLYIKGGPDKGGRYLFNCLIGMTPVTNKLACRFVKSTGFVEVGVVPQSDIDPLTGEAVDCMMTYCTREVLDNIDRYRERRLANNGGGNEN